MAVDLATAKQAAKKRGLSPPPEWQGKEDQWYQTWFQNGIDSGDPSILKDAGLWTGAEAAPEVSDKNATQGYNKDYMNAAPSTEWLGKRKPTPSELRRYARDQGWSEDYARFSDAQLANWLNNGGWDVNAGIFSGGVQKPTETGGLMDPAHMGTAGGGGGGGGGGGAGGGPGGGGPGGGGYGGAGTFGGAPGFGFTAPTLEQAMQDPGYQFALKQGADALQSSAAAQGLLRTSGTLKDLMKYGQDMASQRYADVYGRNYQLAKDKFAPQYGSWETSGNWNLQKYLQREQNIYGLMNPSMPGY